MLRRQRVLLAVLALTLLSVVGCGETEPAPTAPTPPAASAPPPPPPSPAPQEPAALASLTLSPTTVQGQGQSEGTITLTAAAPSAGALVALQSGTREVARVPSSVTVAAGATTATFRIDTSTVAASSSVTIHATHANQTRTAVLTVLPPPIVTADSVTPSSGSGATQTFAFQYSHSQGAAQILSVQLNFRASSTTNVLDSCLAQYGPAANWLSLATDGLSDWRSGTLGTAVTLQNNQCAIALGSSSVTLAGNTLTLKLAVTFKPAFAGSKDIHMYAYAGTASSGWHDRGDWIVPGPTAPLVTGR